MSLTKLVGTGVAALALGAALTTGTAAAEPLAPAPVVAPGEPAPGGASSGSAVTDLFQTLIRTMQCGSAYSCDY